MAVAKEASGEIVKARTDKREYRRIVLPNSLQVLLVSDPDTDKANPKSPRTIRSCVFVDFNLTIFAFSVSFLISFVAVCCFHGCPRWLLLRPWWPRRTRPFSWYLFFLIIMEMSFFWWLNLCCCSCVDDLFGFYSVSAFEFVVLQMSVLVLYSKLGWIMKPGLFWLAEMIACKGEWRIWSTEC